MMEQWNIGNNNQRLEMLCRKIWLFFKPIIPKFHYSNIPRGLSMAKPLVSDLADRARFSSMQ
ncbi:MAG: hypothetical protein CVU64_17760 [Deltaproteobacteria bacterium HGW-Deltaproteobacteria-21]|nr:MAG: hypothetical protein CVU64_17760 [Deltaproteobacteria bacterium HGW-Deltaproteobacteria-21]